MQHVWATERTNVQLLITSSITLSSSIPLCSPGPMLQASSGGPDQWSVISDHNHRHLPHQHHQHLVEGALTLYWPGKRGQNSKRGRAASLVEKQYSWKKKCFFMSLLSSPWSKCYLTETIWVLKQPWVELFWHLEFMCLGWYCSSYQWVYVSRYLSGALFDPRAAVVIYFIASQPTLLYNKI